MYVQTHTPNDPVLRYGQRKRDWCVNRTLTFEGCSVLPVSISHNHQELNPRYLYMAGGPAENRISKLDELLYE